MARPVGSKNRKTLATERQIRKLKAAGSDPKEYLIGVMKGTHEHDPIKVRAAEVLMEFYYPKLQRTTVKADVRITHEEMLDELE